jgi:hypothetical protein
MNYKLSPNAAPGHEFACPLYQKHQKREKLKKKKSRRKQYSVTITKKVIGCNFLKLQVEITIIRYWGQLFLQGIFTTGGTHWQETMEGQ